MLRICHSLLRVPPLGLVVQAAPRWKRLHLPSLPLNDPITRTPRRRQWLAPGAFALLAVLALVLVATAEGRPAASAQLSQAPDNGLPDNVSPSVVATRMVCSFANSDARGAHIQGADGGASVLVGDTSYWLFGDTLLLPESGRQIQPNALAWSTTRSPDGCPSLQYFTDAGVAAPLLDKDGSLTAWPSGAWPIDDHTFDFFTVYVYGSGPFAYNIGEIGLAQLDTRTMQVRAASRDLWDARSGFTSQVIGAQPVELDHDGFLRIILGTRDGDELLARAAPDSLSNPDTYEFWDGDGWSHDPARASALWSQVAPSDPVQRLASFSGGVSIAYNRYLGKYVAVQNVGFDKIGARVADRLEGPWSAPTAWLDCSTLAAPAVPVCYSPYQHPELSSPDGRTIVLTFTRMASYDVVVYEVTLGVPVRAIGEAGASGTETPTVAAGTQQTPTSPALAAQQTSTPTAPIQTPEGVATRAGATGLASSPPATATPSPMAAEGAAVVSPGSIAGTVTNALGTPIAGASVSANSSPCCGGSGSTTTAGDGTYVITGLAPGSYKVQAQASGYAPTYYNGTYDYNAATLVAVASGTTTPGINFALAPAGGITGTVTNALGTPIAGASVEASRAACCGYGYATTAGDGTYTITDLEPGSYRVQAQAPGYAPTYYNATYDYNTATLVPVTSGSVAPGINFGLAQAGGIAGTVTNALGTPIAGASVYASSSTCCLPGGGTTTAGDGTYAITDLAPGSYKVQAQASGYAPTYYNGTYDYNAATPVTAMSGTTTPGINFALAQAGSIAGTVTNALSTPIAGASLMACPVVGGLCGSATSAGDGTYVITGLAPGSHIVSAQASGYAPTYYNGTYNYSAATLVTVTSGSTTPGINFALAPAGSIAGTVTNALGTPIAGVTVSANPSSCCGSGGSTTTAGDGTYVITGLAPGNYTMQAQASGYAPTYYNGTYDYGAATPVTVASGTTTPGVNFALAQAGSISGTVTNAIGTPIAGAIVSASRTACCGYGYTTAAGDGTYAITGLAPGSYKVQAQAPGYAPTYYNGTYDYSAATLVAVASGATTPGINFALAPAGSITGTVTNAFGTPIAGADVSANSSTCCGGGSATTAVDGTYTVTGLTPGSYTVQAQASGYAPTYYNGTYDYSAATPVTVTSGTTTPGINFALAQAGRIAGNVTNALGTPIAGANVWASASGCCGGGSTTTAADGTYLMTNLVPASYVVQAQASGYASTYYNGTYEYGAATLVTVTSGTTTPGINFALAQAGSIAGNVTDALGTPIAGASVEASGAACCGSGYATTAADGTYVITDLVPGSYRVWASGSTCGFSSPPSLSCVVYPQRYYNGTYDYGAATLVPVASGATTPGINFALAAGGGITGTVTNALGTPIAGANVSAYATTCCAYGGLATTAADGTYVLAGLPPVPTIVQASVICPPPAPPSSPPAGPCTPYPVWYYDGTCEYAAATPVSVASGGTATNINITLRPANPDCFDQAVPVGGLPYTDARSTAGASTAPGENLPCGNMGATVWYQYTAPSSAVKFRTTSVDTVGSNFNTVVAVYSQGVSPPSILTLVGCNASGSGSLVNFSASPDTRYYIQIGGQSGATGQLTVHVSPDTDGDGYTDIEETRLGEDPLTFCPIMRADVTGDGVVAIDDIGKVAIYFAQAIPPAPARYDQYFDGKITIPDLGKQALVFGQHVGACP